MSGYIRHQRYPELFKYPGSTIWWMQLPNPKGGRHIRESTGQRDDVAAHRVYLERVRKNPVDGSEKKERTLNTALLNRIEWLKSNRKNNDPSRKKLAEDTIKFYEKKSGVLVRVLGPNLLLSGITPETIRQYIQQRTDEGTKGNTIGKELTALSMAMKMAKRDGVSCGSVTEMKPEDFQALYVPRERWLTREEYDRFMRWWYANRSAAKGGVLDFIVSTGSTYPSEVAHSKRSEMNMETFEVHIRGTKRELRDRTFIVPSDRRHLFERAMRNADGKNDSLFAAWGNVRRDILIACAYLSMCKDCEQSKNLWWRSGNSLVRGTSQTMGTPCRDPKCPECKKVPVFEPFCPTDLRRTFAQWLMQAGVPYELAYPLMGHSDDRMLKQVYGKRKASDVSPLIEAVLEKVPKPRHLRAV